MKAFIGRLILSGSGFAPGPDAGVIGGVAIPPSLLMGLVADIEPFGEETPVLPPGVEAGGGGCCCPCPEGGGDTWLL